MVTPVLSSLRRSISFRRVSVQLFFSLFILLSCFWTVPLFSQDVLILEDETTNSSNDKGSALTNEQDPVNSDESYLDVYKRWSQFVRASEAGDSYRAETAVFAIIEMRRRNSIPAIPELAHAAVEFGNLEWSRKKPEEALKLYRAASALDPALSAAYYAQARIHLSSGIRGFLPAIEYAVRGWFAPLYSVTGKIYFHSKLVIILLVTLLLLAFAFAALLLLKYSYLLVHNAVERYGSRYSPGLIQLVVWVILFLPILLLAGPFWLAPFWFFLLWGYMRTSERILAILFFLITALAYPVYHRIAQNSAMLTDSEVLPYVTVFVEGPSVRAINDMEDYFRTHPTDADASILLASLYASDNKMDRAVRLLQKHILDHPSDPRGYNNLAAIFFSQEQTDSALQLTQKAYSLDSGNLIYVFNLSKAFRARFNFGEATRLLEAARSANPALISRLEEIPTEKLVIVAPKDELVFQRLETKNGSLLPNFLNPFSIAAIGLLVLAVLMNLSSSRKRSLARSCSKCGKAFCIKCQANTKVSDYCTQCLHIFIKKDGISPVSRKEKMEQIGVFTRRQYTLSRISSLVLPGASHLYKNETFRGALILLIWFFFLAVLWFNWRFSTTYFEPTGSASVLNLICVVALALTYFLANFGMIRSAKS